jgi:hypothetical protein
MPALPIRMLRTLGGAPDIDKYPSDKVDAGTRSKFTVGGAGLILVAIVSALCAGVSWGLVTKIALLGVGVGFVWAWINGFFNFTVGSLIDDMHGKGFTRKSGVLLLAISLVSVMAYINSSSIQMWTMRDEITQVIEGDYHAKRAVLDREKDRLNSTYAGDLLKLRSKAAADLDKVGAPQGGIQKLESEEASLRRDYLTALSEVNREADGHAPSGQVGVGSRTRLKQQTADSVKGLLDAKVAELAATRTRANSSTDTRANEIRQTLARDEGQLKSDFDNNTRSLSGRYEELGSEPRYGFSDRHLALFRLFLRDPLWMGSMFVVFFILELLFVIYKLWNNNTTYHAIKAAERAKVHANLAAEIAQDAEVVRQHEAGEAERARAHQKVMSGHKKAELDDRMQELADHLQTLRDNGTPEEDVQKARRRWLKDHGLLKVVGAA